MACLVTDLDSARGLVGDPVDVVTGANLDRALDFALDGPLPLEWFRHYDSRDCARDRGLGWGHRHELDRELRFDVDGIRYVDPTGKVTGFPFLLRDGITAATAGLVLERVDAWRFRVHRRDAPTMEFYLPAPEVPAYLTALRDDRAEVGLQYGADGRLVGLVDSRGRSVRVDWREGRIAALALVQPGQADRPLVAYRYDASGCLVEGTDPYAQRFAYAHDAANRVTRRTDRRGYSFLYDYDGQGRCVRARGEDGVEEVHLAYFAEERRTVVTRGDGGVWTYLFDETQTVTQIVDPYGGIQRFERDGEGRIAEEVDPEGNVTRILFDEAGGPMARLDHLGRVKRVGEDVDPGHRVGWCALQWEYGDLQAPGFTLPMPGELAFLLPEPIAARLTTTSAITETPTRIVRDALGLPLREELPNGRARSWGRDPNGNVRRYTDFDGRTYSSEYASWNHRVATTGPTGEVEHFAYAANDQLVTVVDAGGTRTDFSWDLKNRLAAVARHGQLRETYHYDKADRLVEKRDAHGSVLLKVAREDEGRTVVRTLASGDEHRFTLGYGGRFLVAGSQAGEVRFAYSLAGRRIRDERDGIGVRHRFAGHALVETRVLDRFVTRYERPSDGVLVIQDPTGRRHRVRTLGHGVFSRELASGVTETVQYDPWGNCLAKVVYRPDAPEQRWERRYPRSSEGDLYAVCDSIRGDRAFEHDAAHRLVSETSPSGVTTELRLDAAGNLLDKPGLAGVTLLPGNRLYTANGSRFEYDARNHIAARHTNAGVVRYAHDARDQLVGIQTPGWGWAARYDALGRRTEKLWDGERTVFYWDTDRLAAEIGPDGRVRVYVYADAFAIVPMLFVDYASLDAEPVAGAVHYVFANHLGAPELVHDADGSVVWSASYEAYGRAHVDVGRDVHQPLRWPGHYWDSETGLHYNRFRYYSPELGRYLESDPIGLGGGTNVYTLARGNPVRWVDVRGLSCPDNDLRGGPTKEDGSDQECTKPSEEAVPPPAVSGETSSTAIGKATHKDQADLRRASGEFDLVNEPIRAKDGSTIEVPHRVNLETGAPADERRQQAQPDACRFSASGLLVDDKPVGRPLAKDRQEIIRFITAYEQREGHPPERIAIQRYDPKTGEPTVTELYSPTDFMPPKRPAEP